MTKEEKRKAARKAAAKYSSNLAFAVIEYGRLTGQLKSVTSKKLQGEMLSLIQIYRHPTNDDYAEFHLFFDPDGVKLKASGYESPFFVEVLEKRRIGDPLLTGIKEYVRESELRKIELAQFKDELNELKKKFSDAMHIAFENKEKRSDSKNALIVQALGLSTGHAPKRINKEIAWSEYVKLVRKEGMCRYDAVKIIKERYGFNSEDATLKGLHERRRSLLQKIKEKYPASYPEAKKRLKGIAPRKGISK